MNTSHLSLNISLSGGILLALILIPTLATSTSTCHQSYRNETTLSTMCGLKHDYSSNSTGFTDYTNKEALKKRLTPLQYHVTQEKGTEGPFTGCFNSISQNNGNYSCVVCDLPLFSSDAKFHSSCGWPAFSDVLDQSRIKLTRDASHGMVRTEVTCSRCTAHLGHMFMDGPPPTRKRFCINSASLNFHPSSVLE